MKNCAVVFIFCGLLGADALDTVCVRDDALNVVVCGEAKLGKLMWQDGERIFIGDWAQAKEYCERLKFAGFEDWRLPNIDELISITDKSKFDPAINPTFKNVRSDLYWSATKDAVSASNAWVAVFKNGEDGWVEAHDKNFARCVRSEK
ncbi:DUF1566 domain-containing protein [uncultured Campylobacter sp.]|uniref:Lcl C-terminal domain-containing protein n=1 Tax=uncultured Campylobacter sp. TaxID=218934 RepID=UPI0025D10556|nr:DUF1566 domain-containing protein [uncultured Campylobacter sp.]